MPHNEKRHDAALALEPRVVVYNNEARGLHFNAVSGTGAARKSMYEATLLPGRNFVPQAAVDLIENDRDSAIHSWLAAGMVEVRLGEEPVGAEGPEFPKKLPGDPDSIRETLLACPHEMLDGYRRQLPAHSEAHEIINRRHSHPNGRPHFWLTGRE